MTGTSKPAEPAGLMSRFRQRLFPLRPAGSVNVAVSREAAVIAAQSRRSITLKAGLAELLLITRLKARSKPIGSVKATDILERATHVVFVTCKNWFTEADGKTPGHRNPL